MAIDSTVFLGFSSASGQLPETRVVPFDVDVLDTPTTAVLLLDKAVTDKQYLVEQRRVEFSQLLERGIRLVLVAGPGAGDAIGRPFVSWLCSKLNLKLIPRMPLAIESEAKELTPFLANQLAYVILDELTDELPDLDEQVLGVAVDAMNAEEGVAAARWSHGRSEIVFLPLRQPFAGSACAWILNALAALPPRGAYPEYLDEIVLLDEDELRSELAEIRVCGDEIQATLEERRQTKRILYEFGTDLEHTVVAFLTDELDVRAEHVPGNNEDFRLVGADGGVWGVGEVKSAESRSVERPDVSKLDVHRNESGFPLDLPALLVANTFHRRQTLAERDQPIASNVTKLAADEHIVIVRTLDLVRLKQLELQRTPRTDELRKALLEGGGWFRVDADLNVRLVAR